jgi:hypothetical protein
MKPTATDKIPVIEAKLANASIQENLNPRQAQALFASVYNDATVASQYRGAALIGLTALSPGEMTKPVVDALSDSDIHLRHAAAAALRKLAPAASEELRKTFQTLTKETQLALLPLWSEQQFSAAEPEVVGCLDSSDETLKLAAVVALRKLGSAAAIPQLLAGAAKGGLLAKEIESTLQQMRGEAVVKALKEATQGKEAAQATLAVKALAARMDPGCISFLLDVAAGPDTKKAEIALTTIKNQATVEALPQLRKLLSEKPELQDNLAQAIIAICKRQQNPRTHLSEFLATPMKAVIEQQLKTLN